MKNSKGLFVKDPNRWRVPRKLKKKIPKDTVYCYTPTGETGVIWNEEYQTEVPWYGIKKCHFYTRKKYKGMKPQPEWIDEEFLNKYKDVEQGWCKLVKYEIDDQCKSCGLRCGK